MKASHTRGFRGSLPYALFFLTGFSGLFLEVLWMRQLRLLLGSTAQSVSLTLAAFFLGIALGSRWWGNRVQGYGNGLRLYGWLEISVAASAVLLLLLKPAFEAIHPWLYGLLGDTVWGMPLAKFLVGAAFLFPPCFFMGGTFPAMTEALYQKRDRLGRGASLLYGLNTIGGAFGALAAGFVAVGSFGFRTSYAFAVLLVLSVGSLALVLSRTPPSPTAPPPGLPTDSVGLAGVPEDRALTWPTLRQLALLSGFTTLALEVLWTRMFEQVLHNSVYTFSLILAAFLVSLGAGGLAARWLATGNWSASTVVIGLATASGLAAGITPFVFTAATDGLGYLGTDEGWGEYVGLVLGTLALTVVAPGILMGALFPYLLKAAEPHAVSTGRTVGALASLNTVGGVAGSLAGAFLFLEAFGLWNGIRAVSAIYFWMALQVGVRLSNGNRAAIVVPVGALACLLFVANPSDLPIVKVSPDKRILQTWEGSSGTVAVVESSRTRAILLNNHYTLGGLLARKYQEAMSHIPLLAHPNPKSVFYIGMGTGITAGGSMLHPVEEVTVTELIPHAVEAARQYFREETHGLFDDPRVEIAAEDGRLFLASSRRNYDVIIGDLFIPWQAGAGSLYSVDHYRNAWERLNVGGMYAQWMPLYQVSEFELGVIAQTLLEVFPAVTLWRGDFFKDRSILLLLAHRDVAPFDPREIEARIEALGRANDLTEFAEPEDFWNRYIGSISGRDSPFEAAPVNRDDRPIIEYTSPITMRRVRAGETRFVRGREFLRLMEWSISDDRLLRGPFLDRLSDLELEWIEAGFDRHRTTILGR